MEKINEKTSGKRRPELSQSDFIKKMPKACMDETAAVELFEEVRWGDSPCCVHCGSIAVYKMTDAETGGRSKRFLWRCRDCRKQYTVRIGAVYEESRLPMRHWAFAFWRASTSKKGAAALEIMRQCQVSYKTALFLMHRIRFALARKDRGRPEKMKGVIEADETYIGGKPRVGRDKRETRTTKVPVFGIVERGGDVHRRVVADVTAKTLIDIVKSKAAYDSTIYTDENHAYHGLCEFFKHDGVKHSAKEYVRGDAHTNTIESSFSLVKRGLMGIHHAVSKEHLHRYLAHWDFLWNARHMNDGERTVLAIRSAEGKRLRYRDPIANKPAPQDSPKDQPPTDQGQMPLF
jgi:transposase-like protein